MKDNQNFENQWQRAFENANESPDPQVWERITRRLDEDEVVVLLPWWSSVGFRVAVSVAILMVSIGLWWFSESLLITNQRLLVGGHKSPTTSPSKQVSKSLITNQQLLVGDYTSPTADYKSRTSTSKQVSKSLIANQEVLVGNYKLPTSPSKQVSKSLITNQEVLVGNYNPPTTEADYDSRTAKSSLEDEAKTFIGNQISTKLSTLTPKGYRYLPGLQAAQLWIPTLAFKVDVPPPPIVSKKIYFASLGVAPTQFNAAISTVQQGLVSYSSSSFANNDITQNTNEPAFSYSLQTSGGIELSSRLSLSSGLNYLRGNSTYTTLGVFDGANFKTVFSEAISNNNTMMDMAVAKSVTNSPAGVLGTNPQFSMVERLQSSMHFLQIPVQLDYALTKPHKKVSLWLMGGVVGNIFLQNSLANRFNNAEIIRSNSGVYRSLSVAATTGVWLKYRVSKHWSATLTGNYQQSVGSITRTSVGFSAKPHLLGLGWGLRHTF
jgi:Outer membrane protein beta-barrel domain